MDDFLYCSYINKRYKPIIRKAIIEYLIKKGFSQVYISKLLNISQPAINKYLNRAIDDSSIYKQIIRYLNSEDIKEDDLRSLEDKLLAMLISDRKLSHSRKMV
ncbi:MAG: hypothetical protein ARM1_0012 [Candidatus Micrarchaeota archaeon]|nr:MAG: hypothetical protein ARM1_0012 [Candidatus Micrarchaeota archaeon]